MGADLLATFAVCFFALVAATDFAPARRNPTTAIGPGSPAAVSELEYAEEQEPPEVALGMAIPDGEVIMLASSKGNALLLLTNQRADPERMDWTLYLPDEGGRFDFAVPSARGRNVDAVNHPPFFLGWSGAGTGEGFLYCGPSPSGEARPPDLKVYRTRTNDLTQVQLDFAHPRYEELRDETGAPPRVVTSNRSFWVGHYALALVRQLVWIVLLVGAILHVRKGLRISGAIQCVGAAILLVWSLADSILWDPNLGLLLRSPMRQKWMYAWSETQTYLLVAALVLFSAGYFASSVTGRRAGKQ